MLHFIQRFLCSYFQNIILGSVILKPEYFVSPRGKCMLTFEGYKFTEVVRKGDRRTWRCAYRENDRYICKTYATTDTFDYQERVYFRGQHCHPPESNLLNENSKKRKSKKKLDEFIG